MAVSIQDLLKPKGPLNRKVLWPGVSKSEVEADLTEWLRQGVAKAAGLTVVVAPDTTLAATKDTAAKHWAIYLARGDVVDRLIHRAASVQFRDEGSRAYFVTQIQMAKDERDAALAAFTALEDAVEEDAEPVTLPPRASASTPIRFTF